MTVALRVLSCQDCCACCMEQGSPPGYVMFLPSSTMPDGVDVRSKDNVWYEDWQRFQTLPLSARIELEDYMADLMAERVSGEGPCIWLDRKTKQCRWYEHRPGICRGLAVNSDGCRRWRKQYRGKPAAPDLSRRREPKGRRHQKPRVT